MENIYNLVDETLEGKTPEGAPSSSSANLARQGGSVDSFTEAFQIVDGSATSGIANPEVAPPLSRSVRQGGFVNSGSVTSNLDHTRLEWSRRDCTGNQQEPCGADTPVRADISGNPVVVQKKVRLDAFQFLREGRGIDGSTESGNKGSSSPSGAAAIGLLTLKWASGMTNITEQRFDQIQLLRNITVNRSMDAEKLERAGKSREAAWLRREADVWLSVQRKYQCML
jgi:hypothetical protein